jgi:hypothetical protein
MIEQYQDFIDILKVIIPQYKNDPDKKHIKSIFVHTIRKVELLLPKDVSIKAQKEADELNLGSLLQYDWNDQTKKHKMNDLGRKIFHYEHFVPIQQQIDDLLKLESYNDLNIYNIISNNKICWILKSENKILDKIAKSKRPNPDEAYHKAGITLLGEKV